jgi:hypothetical protein
MVVIGALGVQPAQIIMIVRTTILICKKEEDRFRPFIFGLELFPY